LNAVPLHDVTSKADSACVTTTLAQRVIFPNKESLTRIVSAILMEIDETWEDGKRYLDMEAE
jgi:transposase-like protein